MQDWILYEFRSKTKEILKINRWVGEDAPEIKLAIESAGPLSQYDPKSYDSMLSLCKTYNKAVDKYLKVC